jgi:predicted nucleic acid-binding protein
MLDTSVIIDLMTIERERLPLEGTIAALTIAELTAGPVAASDAVQRAQRLERLQQTEALFETIPFDRAAAHAYARIYAAAMLVNQKPRGSRAVDMLIAATALSRGIPLYTRNPHDFGAVATLMEIVAV